MSVNEEEQKTWEGRRALGAEHIGRRTQKPMSTASDSVADLSSLLNHLAVEVDGLFGCGADEEAVMVKRMAEAVQALRARIATLEEQNKALKASVVLGCHDACLSGCRHDQLEAQLAQVKADRTFFEADVQRLGAENARLAELLRLRNPLPGDGQ